MPTYVLFGTERSVRVLLGVVQSEAITSARQRQRLNWGAGHCWRLADTRKHFDTRRSQTARQTVPEIVPTDSLHQAATATSSQVGRSGEV